MHKAHNILKGRCTKDVFIYIICYFKASSFTHMTFRLHKLFRVEYQSWQTLVPIHFHCMKKSNSGILWKNLDLNLSRRELWKLSGWQNCSQCLRITHGITISSPSLTFLRVKLCSLFNSFVNLALIVLMRRGGETSLNWLLRIKTMLIGFL